MENKLYVPNAPIYKFTIELGLANFEIFAPDYDEAIRKLNSIIYKSSPNLKKKTPILLQVIELKQ